MILDNLYLIVAITEKTNAIGNNNNLIYFSREDMNFFKEKTIGNNIICGRKTFEGFTIKPLPKRKNIVLTKSDFEFKNTIVFKSVESLLEYIKKNNNEIFYLCGGESIYRQMMDYCSKMYITKYEELTEVKADSHFPKIDKNKWKIVETVYGVNEDPKLKFYTYERINNEK